MSSILILTTSNTLGSHTSTMMGDISKVVLATFAGMLLLVVNKVAAVEYVVGDNQGWTNGFDYQQWAKDKVFKVGDRLVFQYAQGYHNVYKVDAKSFNKCQVPLQTEPLTSGNDIIELKSPGKKWYICGVDDHCALSKQKLTINVMPPDLWWLPSSPPTIAPAPSPLDPIIALPPWFNWLPFGTPPTPAPAYGGYSNSKNDKKSLWEMPIMPPSPYSYIPPFWIPYLPIGNAPSPSPYFESRDESRSVAEAPWMLPTFPFPWMFPPTPAAISPSMPSPSPSYAMNEYSSDAYGLTGNMAQILMISIVIGLAMAGLV